ncbi:MAG: hypothetical protein LUG15_08045 [Oscillospiraceae bacterium]|nr:hypothetical protein [Oscillospiraceae bacterium]
MEDEKKTIEMPVKELYCVAKLIQGILWGDEESGCGAFYGCNFCKYFSECMTILPDGQMITRILDSAMATMWREAGVDLSFHHHSREERFKDTFPFSEMFTSCPDIPQKDNNQTTAP